MKSRRPRPTLFPYTTLFRSRERGALLRGDRDATQLAPLDLRERVGEVGEGEADLPAEHVGDRLDRKSTRLNSSHGYISYAVLCLQKNTIHRCIHHHIDYVLP